MIKGLTPQTTEVPESYRFAFFFFKLSVNFKYQIHFANKMICVYYRKFCHRLTNKYYGSLNLQHSQ